MPEPLKAGITLRERYCINCIIGQGGMGCIYLADDMRLEGRQCALKEVEHDLSLPEDLLKEAREQFLREATVLGRLDQANLPKVSDYFSIGNRDYLVMDYIPGKDLRTLMLEANRRGTLLEEEDVIEWAEQLSVALAYLHGQEPPILHRDIKPSNIKLTPSGTLKLVDFGLVKLLAPGDVTITILQGQGTAIYTPLEQYGGDSSHTDARTDIYSLGATLYHLLTNKAPAIARERFINPDALVPPRQVNPQISMRMERAILWAMGLHPNERPQSVDEFRKYLLGESNIRAQEKRRMLNIFDVLRLWPERLLVGSAALLLIFSLIATILG